MHVPILLAVMLVLITKIVAGVKSSQCYNPQKDFYPFMGTRTALKRLEPHGNLKPKIGTNCKPMQLWVLVRHGTKYPENTEIPKYMNLTKFQDQILKNHKNGTGQLCEKDLQNLKYWKLDSNINEKTNEDLTAQGELDLLDYAKRLKKAFPELLSGKSVHTFHPNNFIFRTTNRGRTLISMASFARGLFGDKMIPMNSQVLPNDDTLLLPHKNCPAWDREFKEKVPNIERKKFTKGPEFDQVLSNITNRLGFKNRLDYDTVKIAYDMCRYEVAWYPQNMSVWCSIFKKEELKIFEYSEDLEYYYCCGPGREMSPKLGCRTLSDMFQHFKSLESSEAANEPKAIFSFAHTMNIQNLLAALRIDKEEKPFNSTSYAYSHKRKYRVSKLGPFATSISAVFYRCAGKKITHKVSLHVAEEPVQLKVCENGLCDWEELKREYNSTITNCNLNFCYDNSNTTNVKF